MSRMDEFKLFMSSHLVNDISIETIVDSADMIASQICGT